MSDQTLLELAQSSGIAPRWRDAFGEMRDVSPDTLRLVLEALDVPARTDAAVQDSLARLRAAGAAIALPPLVTADMDRPVAIGAAPGRFKLTLESGEIIEGAAGEAACGAELPAIAVAGYHDLEIGGLETTIAVAPPRCFGIADADPSGRLWGLAVQLYALRRAGDGGIGDFAALAEFVREAAQAGASAVAISPIHAQFSADVNRFSPYSPSSRTQLNVLHADVDALLPPDDLAAAFESLPLIDWPGASRARLARFRRGFERLNAQPDGVLAAEFAAFRAAQGDALETHARFEALHGHFYGQTAGLWHWRSWPEEFRNPASPAVARFAADHAGEVSFHAFLQFLADRGLAAAQHAARAAGMPIGLIADLAVGADSGGSQAWARQGETLIGLSVGAPPDILATRGQDWGLTAFSPTGLERHGFGAYLEMLRSAVRHAGGVRIDHVMGLARLWVLPEGASAAHGAYLHYPLTDLMRLIALESWRHRAVVLGEDLGTVPDGFQEQLTERELMGLRVLWFEKDGSRFRRPQYWTRDAAAMTSTHDLATVAGWWTGHDLDLRRSLDMLGDEHGVSRAYDERAGERGELWNALCETEAAIGPAPPPDDPKLVVDAAIRQIGLSNCALALLPIEDALGAIDQPNLPGTQDEHPNWRRRLPAPANTVLTPPDTAARLTALAVARGVGG